MKKKNFIFQNIHDFKELKLLLDQNLDLISGSFFEPSMIQFSLDAFRHLPIEKQDDLLHFAHFIDCRLDSLDVIKFCSLLSYSVYLKYYPEQIADFSDKALIPLMLYSYMEPRSFYENQPYSSSLLETVYQRGRDSSGMISYMEIVNDLLESGQSISDISSFFSSASSEDLKQMIQDYGKKITKQSDQIGVHL